MHSEMNESFEKEKMSEFTSISTIEYDGKLKELMKLHLKNIFFSVITLGIYSFWAEAHNRRYLWSHMSFAGERLEYTGLGIETFKGFIRVVAIFLLIYIVLFGALYFIVGSKFALPITTYIVYFSLFLLFPIGQFSALRYRLTRTSWRGLRGNLVGSSISYMIKYWGYSFLSALTLGAMLPFIQMHITLYPLTHMKLGDTFFKFNATVSQTPYRSYLIGYVCLLLSALGLFLAFVGELYYIVVALLLLPVAVMAFFHWQAKMFCFMANHLALAGGKFHGTFTGRSVFYLFAGNFLITVLSLGLLMPWAWHRTALYISKNLAFRSTGGLEDLVQNSDSRPNYGEGLAEFVGL